MQLKQRFRDLTCIALIKGASFLRAMCCRCQFDIDALRLLRSSGFPRKYTTGIPPSNIVATIFVRQLVRCCFVCVSRARSSFPNNVRAVPIAMS